MWISELSERTTIPVDTIKHYLRIGVLPKGEAVGPLRAEYDESHVARLVLIKALHDVGRLSLEQIRLVFDSMDESQTTLRNAVGQAHLLLSAELAESSAPSERSLAVVDDLIVRQGWRIEESSKHRQALAVAIDTLVGIRGEDYRESPSLVKLLDLYATHALQVARDELGYVDTDTRESTLNSVVVGSVLFEPLVLVVRRLAQQEASRDWWAEAKWRELQD